ncbi:MAG TPA: ATP-dependent DNA ligase [Burkholderiaceae bacterium]|nr:ATP-dependent DNA ligase [Burkholderiaceae bacterium]
MRSFATLYAELDASTSTLAKVEALRRYFASAPAEDAAWAVYFLAGGKPRQTVPTRVLRDTARDAAGLPEWLFEESYQAVGDLAETIAHVLPMPEGDDTAGLAHWIEHRLLPLKGLAPEELGPRLRDYWTRLDTRGRFLLTKLIGGGFRVGVSKLLVVRALAENAGLDPKRVAQRIVGYTDARAQPTAERYLALIATGDAEHREDAGQPYPFFLAHQLNENEPDRLQALLGSPSEWIVEWKWDGIRAQVVKRAGECWIWSRGEELMTERFPELAALVALPDGTVLDGEILVWRGEHESRPAPFADLQTRIGRKTLSKKVLSDAPVVFLAYDLLEDAGIDLRSRPHHERRQRLDALVAAHALSVLRMSPEVIAASWHALAQLREESRQRGVEGFMLKARTGPYGVGRTKADSTWWKWKIDPMSVDAVLVYAQPGHGRRASLYTDYTFAVWHEPDPSTRPGERVLVPFAKAYSGLTDEEIRSIDAIIRKTTIEKFGPVRSVTPTLVMEIGFEGIQRSPRHKSGIAVRFPRILRLRPDKPVNEADTLASLNALLANTGVEP